MTFEQQLIVTLVQTLAPAILLVLGGKWILDRHEIARKRREQEIELARFVREQQYAALLEMYQLFGQFMCLYRQINDPRTDVGRREVCTPLSEAAVGAESKVDALILRIASEFTHENRQLLEDCLANLRQSVQIFRECLREGQKLPFNRAEQEDYVRFKSAFVRTATYLAGRIYGRLEPVELSVQESQTLLADIFSNKHERHGYHV